MHTSFDLNFNLLKTRIGKIITFVLIIASATYIPQSSSFATTYPSSVALGPTDSLSFNHANAKNIVGDGTHVGDVVLYQGIGTFSGTTIDAVVTTEALSGSISNYDNPGSASTVTGSANYFMVNTVGGSVTFNIAFYISGTYTTLNSGVPITLQNVNINSLDLDSSSAPGSYQYTDFNGFQSYSLTADTNLKVFPQSNTTPQSVRFEAGLAGSRPSVPQDQVLVNFAQIQNLNVTFGNVVSGSTNYFGLVFGPWSNTGTPVQYPNVFSAAPTTTDTATYVKVSTSQTWYASNFGNFSDPNGNALAGVVITTLPSQGTIYLSGVAVTAGQLISINDLNAGNLTYTAPGSTGTTSFTFQVNNGSVNSSPANNFTINIVPQAQTITFTTPSTQSSGTTFASGATTTATGLTPVLTSLTPGICTVSGLNITTVANGTCVITATQAGNSTYGAAVPVQVNFLVSSGTSQTITFAQPSTQSVGATINSGATASSTLPVTLVSNTPSICTVNVLTITTVSAGSCSITASQTGGIVGSTTYAAATPVTQSFNVTAPASSTSIAAQTIGANVAKTGSSTDTATLIGAVSANGNATTYEFCYSSSSRQSGGVISSRSCTYTSTSPVSSSAAANLLVSSSSISFSSSYTKTYYYQIIAWPTANSSAKVYGQILSFQITNLGSGGASTIQTNAATSVATTSATLNGNIGLPSTGTFSFCLGTSLSVNSYSISPGNSLLNCSTVYTLSNVSSGSSNAESFVMTGLTAGTTYYYQAVGSATTTSFGRSSTTTTYGGVVSFTTQLAPPVVYTVAATNVKGSTVTLNGSVLNYGSTTSLSFCYGTSPTLSGCTAVNANPSSYSSSGTSSFLVNLTGLSSATTYYFKAVASGSSNTASILSFTTGAPTATTLGASNIASDFSSAQLNGFFNPNGGTSDNSFCWGTSNAVNGVGALTSCTPVSALPATSTVSSLATATISGLSSGTTYYYQAIAAADSNHALISYGVVVSISTFSAASVTTGNASNVSYNSATLPETISPNGLAATGYICISTSNLIDPDSGVMPACMFYPQTGVAPISPTSSIETTTITGLSAGTTYYYQAVAQNAAGTVYGSMLSFTTTSLPSAVVGAATNVTGTSATLNGSAAALSANTTSVTFCYTTDSTFSSGCTSVTASVTGITGSTNYNESATVTGLTSGTTYYFEVIDSNTVGTSVSTVNSFYTGAATATTGSATNITATTAVLNGAAITGGDNNTPITQQLIISTSNGTDITGQLLTNFDGGVGIVANSTSNVTSNASPGNSDSYTVTGLTSGTTYYFQNIVNDNAGNGNNGAVVSFMTLSQVTFNANGGTGSPVIQTSGTTTTLTPFSSMSMSKSGSTFAGWNTQPDGTGASYTDGASYNFALGSMSLYAQWSANLFTVTFNGNSPTSGSPSVGSVTQSSSSSPVTLAGAGTLQKTGYSFGGWSDGTNTYPPSSSYIPEANTTLTAVWSKNSYNITFDANGGLFAGSVATSTVSVLYNADAIDSAPSAPTYTSWNFAGWGTTSATTTAVTSYIVSSNATLYAIWSNAPVSYTVTFDGNSPTSGSPDSSTVTQSAPGAAIAMSGPGTLVKTGYTFGGWSDGTHTYAATYNSYIPTEPITLSAVWNINSYTVTYDAHGGTYTGGGNTTAQSANYNTDAIANAPTPPSYSGYNFVGWNTDSSTSTALTSSTVTGALTLYAIWSLAPVLYTVTFDGNSPTSGAPDSPSITQASAGAPITLSLARSLVKTGYSFGGWSDGVNTFDAGLPYTPTQSLTLHAVWIINTFNVNYDANGGSFAGGATTNLLTLNYNTDAIGSAPTAPTYSGYNFVGWNTDNTQSSGLSIYPTTANVDLYAIWSAVQNTPQTNTPAPVRVVPPTTTPTTPVVTTPVVTTPVVTPPKVTPPVVVTPTPVVAAPVVASVKDVLGTKQVEPNQIIPVAMTVKVNLAASDILNQVVVNGKVVVSTPTNPEAVVLPQLVGPKDKVVAIVTTPTGAITEVPIKVVNKPFNIANVNFATALYSLDSKAKSILKKVADVVKQHGFTTITLIGHTDTQGVAVNYNNQTLSDNRAKESAAYLRTLLKGTDVKIVIAGKSYTEPIASNNDAVGQKLNRRVEISVK